jgi:anthranilate synthase component 2
MYLLIDNYDSFTYNLYALFRECGADVRVVKNDVMIPADDFAGVILSPGPSSPQHSGTTLRYIDLYLGRKPFFGVCLGMQALAHTLGYPVIRARSVKHGKVDAINVLRRSVLFRGLPDRFSAVRYHSLAVDIDDDLVTSRSGDDGTAMSIEDPARKLFGVQFHPESILSEEGARIVGNFIAFTADTCKRSMEERHGRTH